MAGAGDAPRAARRGRGHRPELEGSQSPRLTAYRQRSLTAPSRRAIAIRPRLRSSGGTALHAVGDHALQHELVEVGAQARGTLAGSRARTHPAVAASHAADESPAPRGRRPSSRPRPRIPGCGPARCACPSEVAEHAHADRLRPSRPAAPPRSPTNRRTLRPGWAPGRRAGVTALAKGCAAAPNSSSRNRAWPRASRYSSRVRAARGRPSGPSQALPGRR